MKKEKRNIWKIRFVKVENNSRFEINEVWNNCEQHKLKKKPISIILFYFLNF